jgi:DNA-binding winged helix-turn-helix (wHTH) protein
VTSRSPYSSATRQHVSAGSYEEGLVGGWNTAPAVKETAYSAPSHGLFWAVSLRAPTGSLWRGAEFLPLLPKDAAILEVLVRHAGRIVTKDALLDAGWPQTYVTDTVIKNGFGQLRLVLGDDRKTPRYIETYPCRGYRFIGTVETPKPAEAFPQSTRLAGQPAAPLPEAPALMVEREPELALLRERFARA